MHGPLNIKFVLMGFRQPKRWCSEDESCEVPSGFISTILNKRVNIPETSVIQYV